MEKAADVLGKALERDPGAIELAPALAATYARLGQREEARAALQLWNPGAREASEQDLQLILNTYHFPYEWSEDREIEDRLIDGLNIAALPLETTVSSLTDLLKRGKPDDRVDAFETIGQFGPKAVDAVPALIDALADKELWVQAQAAIALGKIGPAAETAIPALTAMPKDNFVWDEVIKALNKIRGK